MSVATITARQTPMAPYLELLQGMNRSQKLAVMAFLVDSLQETEDAAPHVQAELLKRNPFTHFRRVSEYSEAEKTAVLDKMRATPVSLETESLITELSLSDDELTDERTRYILGLDK